MAATALFGAADVGAQQVADTLHLPAVEIAAPRLATFAAGTKVQQIDSATLARYAHTDLGELLAGESPVSVKSYGLGSLATTSFRGGSAGHTAILWNGINLGSAMNGQADLALIPVGIADAISVQYGGSTALWGSGALGGAVHLEKSPRFGTGLHVKGGTSFGSFTRQSQHLQAELAKDRWTTGLTFFNTTAENDIAFNKGSADAPVQQRQTNAAFSQYGLLLDQQLLLGQADRISVHYWHQRSNRHVPPTLVQTASTAYQLDGGDRLVAEWRHSRRTWGSTVRGAWLDDRIAWFSTQDAEAALSRSGTMVADAEARWRPPGPHTLDLGASFTHAKAWSDGYLGGAGQDRQALFVLYRFHPGKGPFTGTAAARQEWVSGQAVPFTASLGGELRVKPWATLKAQAARLYRVPTLNDLYWQPGGDPGLLPEQGYSGDLGAEFSHRWAAAEWHCEITWFNRWVDNWIIWLPGPQWWSPGNIMQVWSRGAETTSRIAWKLGGSTLKCGMGTGYVASTNQVAKSRFDDSKGKQLIYVPMYTGHAHIGVARARASLFISGTYSGYRYTSTDNRDFLPPYWLLGANASLCAVKRPRWQADLFLRANNLLGTEYQLILNRPMPLRSFEGGLSIHFNRPDALASHEP
ncbi:MAG: TonB-dependent receptor [Flavobacteriales bacterium]|nr:TonB-dependent receptor [Flavobacteriales bacterium]